MAHAAKIDLNKEYLDASPTDFSEKVQALLIAEREIYDMLKQAKAEVLTQVKAEMEVEEGREVKGTTYTAWGQWQVIIGDKTKPKAQAGTQRRSLAEYREEQQASGRAA